MGVNYTQACILGFKLDPEDIIVVTEEAQYVDQDRFDTKTGKVTHVERVCSKREKSHYEFLGVQATDLWILGDALSRDHCLQYFIGGYEDHCLYLGYKIGDTEDYGRTEMIDDEIDIKDIVEKANDLRERFPGNQVKLYFATSIG